MVSRRTAFDICLGMAIVAGLWAVVWSGATSAIFSDLTRYGIEYRGAAFLEIVAIAQRQLVFVCGPLAVSLIVSLVVWGIQVRQEGRRLMTRLEEIDDVLPGTPRQVSGN